MKFQQFKPIPKNAQIPGLHSTVLSISGARKNVAHYTAQALNAKVSHREDFYSMYSSLAAMCLAIISHKSIRMSEIVTANLVADMIVNQRIEDALDYMIDHDADTGIRSRPGWIRYGRDMYELDTFPTR